MHCLEEALVSHTLMYDWDTVNSRRDWGQYLTHTTLFGWLLNEAFSLPVCKSQILAVRSEKQNHIKTCLHFSEFQFCFLCFFGIYNH